MRVHFITMVLVFLAVKINSSKTPHGSSVPKSFEDKAIVPGIISKPPPELLEVTYETASAKLGNNVCPLRSILPPVISFNVKSGSYYTFVFIDPDLPSRAAPTVRNRLLALYVNMDSTELSSGFPLASYVPPIPVPGSGRHRCVALVYEQSGRIDIYNKSLITPPLIERVRFSVKEFAMQNSLGDPIAGNFFYSEMQNNYEGECNKYIFSY